jgi:activator of HSP90 ATPase
MLANIEVSVVINVPAKVLYEAWLDSDEHSAFTGSHAEVDPRVGGKHAAWDEYIVGEILELEPNRRILQSWRTSEFPAENQDSKLEILFNEEDSGTRITLIHKDLPESQAENYRQGWVDNYFEPMASYFTG